MTRGHAGTRKKGKEGESRGLQEEKDKAWPGGGAYPRIPRGLFGEQRACRLADDRGTSERRRKREKEREKKRGDVRIVYASVCPRVFLRDLAGRLTRHRK